MTELLKPNYVEIMEISNPFSVEFYLSLDKMEKWLETATKPFSITLFNSLIQMYTKCVEYYDTQNDPIKHYFIQKIRNTFYQQNIAIKEVLFKQVCQEQFTNTLDKSTFVEKLRQSISGLTIPPLNNEVPQKKSDEQVIAILEDFNASADQNDDFINQQLVVQRQQVEARLRRRKRVPKSLLSNRQTSSVPMLDQLLSPSKIIDEEFQVI